ncbi:MAG TPA: phosphopantetheine-binding protein [Anaeromyxobacteraceae bacterium]|nr:phosphopantetheine-binding protein [Anaeromyxobacteraceae bacterium]
MTGVEEAVAREIRRIARDELRLAVEAGDGDELASSLDSLALLSLVVAVEDRFHVALTEEDAAHARSLADLARVVASRAPPEVLPP